MNAPNQDVAIQIDLGTLYSLVVETRDDVRYVKQALDDLKNDNADHEARLRDLEKSVPDDVKGRLKALEHTAWKLAGAAAVLGAGGGAGVWALLS